VATPLCGAWGSAPLSDGNCESNFLADKKHPTPVELGVFYFAPSLLFVAFWDILLDL